MQGKFKELKVPNGPTLKYKLPKDLGNERQWFRTRFYLDQLENTQKLKKSRLPILGLQNMVCLDYDKKDYPTGWTADRLKNALELHSSPSQSAETSKPSSYWTEQFQATSTPS